ncbi:polysialyltransferase family glycosyltransferase [Enterocloster bolteae]|uniref:polysialyltransferase family glycosyltransferase n=1 Tax=Enterocloster bolteae TaxID=208479 RepID=UPI0018A022EF|nr:polysialyltransferase family glycosyltransferase [Enterocloster bolteae]
MKAVIVCTPYQIFTAISFRSSGIFDSEVDMIILNYFDMAVKIGERIKAKGLFHDVYIVNSRHMSQKTINGNKYVNWFYRLQYLCQYNELVPELFGQCKVPKYQELWYSFEDIFVLMLAKYLTKQSHLKINLFEDGTGSYTEAMRKKKKRWYYLLMRVLNMPEQMQSYNPLPLYLYHPQMASFSIEQKVYSIPKVTDEDIYRNQINDIFDWKIEYEIKEPVIFLDGLFGDINSSNSMQINTCKILADSFGIDNLIIKKHPRRIDNIYEENGFKCYKGENLPFEVFCLNCHFSNKLIVSGFSTAAFTPDLLFHQKVKVIFLYKYYLNGRAIIDAEKYIHLYKEYRGGNNIYEPQDEETLKGLLKGVFVTGGEVYDIAT